MFNLEKVYTSWSWQRLGRHVVYWLLWLLFFATINTNYQEKSFWSWIQVELIVMTIKLPFTYFVIYYLVPLFLLKKAYVQFLFWTILIGIIGGVAISALNHYIINPYILDNTWPTYWNTKIGYKVLDLVYIALLPTILKLLQYQIQQEKLNRQISEEKLNAELKLLKNQLQPHFLFNTLNNLYGMVLTQDERSPQIVLRLSEIMSYMLYEIDVPSIALEKEIEQLKNYIELEKVRHGKRLDLAFEQSGSMDGKRIAPLLMLPFVENAFKHGVANTEKKSWIRINIWTKDDKLEMIVENGIPEQSEEAEMDTKVLGGSNYF
ncbi:MAG: sensor histidine kinase [Bacteroidota bacterium]